jgi:hypothetical protein
MARRKAPAQPRRDEHEPPPREPFIPPYPQLRPHTEQAARLRRVLADYTIWQIRQ